MKNIYLFSSRMLIALCVAFSFTQTTFSQKGIENWLKEIKKDKVFEKEDCVKPTSKERSDNELFEGNTLEIDQNLLKSLYEKPKPAITLTVPISSTKSLVLELARIQLTTSDFKVSSGNGINENKIDESIHYRGMVVGDATSMVAISIYKDEIRGFISGKDGNWELGKTKDSQKDQTVFQTKNLKTTLPFACGTTDKTIGKNFRLDVEQSVQSTAGIGCKVIKVYFECDYQMYLDNGSSVSNVTNYVTSFFNQVATLYQNENIDIQISEIYVWTTADPYRSMTATSTILQAFDVNRGANFNGNLAHFLTTRNVGGGIAYVGTLCSKSYAHGVSMIYNSFATYPTYSWTVEVVAHELGHNIGSNHTHWCGWQKPDGTVGPIDNCYTPEGGCTTGGTTPTNGGTVMSYCHLTSTGINFSNGFGTLPGNAIRNSVSTATCLTTSGSTLAAPTGQLTSNIANNSATVSWNSVPNAASYTVEYKASSATNWTVLPNTSSTTSNITGLNSGTNYDWRVKCDCSGYSTTTTFSTTGTASCTAPVSLSSSNIASNSATVSWALVSGATSYTLQYKTSASTTWLTASSTISTNTYNLTGLSASTTYNFQVKADCSPYSSTASFTTLSASCTAPTSLGSTNITSTSATVSWALVSGATSYTLQYKTSASTTWLTASSTISTNTYNLTGFSASTTYNFQVKADCSAYSATASFTTLSASCTAPVSLSSSNIASNSVTVSWALVSGATSYTLQYKTSASTTWLTASSTISTNSYNLTGLSASTTYNFQVKANCSAYSTTASFTTLSASCTAPVSLSSSNIASNSATVSWALLSGATSYTLQYKTSASTTWLTASSTISMNTYNLTGLSASTTYNFQVKANCSAYSTTASFTTLSASCTTPTGLGSTNISSTSATVSWALVSGATSYILQYKTSASTTWLTASSTISTNTYNLTGLSASTTYNFQVKANCSAYSATASFTTSAATCNTPSNLKVSSVGNTSATLSWASVTGATNYTIQYKLSTASTWTTATTTSSLSYNLKNLTTNKLYNWQIKTNCSAYVQGSDFATGTSGCSAPINLIASNIAGTSVTLTWGTVSGASNYTIQYKKSSSTSWTTVSNLSTTTYNLSGLSGVTTYNWQVKANCSAYSSTFTFTTTNSSCSAPTNLVTNQIAATSAVLQWAAVMGAVNYTIQYKKSTTTTWTTLTATSATSYQLTGLTAGTTYQWQVKANCSVYASSVSFITPAAIVATSCTPPTELKTTNVLSNSVNISWKAVTGATSYSVQYKKALSVDWTTISDLKTTSTIINNLSPNVIYEWKVKTNCSAYTISQMFKTQLATLSFAETILSTEELVFTIFPNPSPDFIRAKVEKSNEIGGYFRITDGSGNIKLLKKIEENEEELNLSELRAGVYIIQMIGKSGKISSKIFVKE